MDGQFVGRIGVPGCAKMGSSVSLYLGKATRVIEMLEPQVPPEELSITGPLLAPAADSTGRIAGGAALRCLIVSGR